jgi:hypothetical protein
MLTTPFLFVFVFHKSINNGESASNWDGSDAWEVEITDYH